MNTVFLDAVAIVLRHEGGYVCDPADPGGETKYGISKRSYPSLDIKNLSVQQARDIYLRDFWMAHKVYLLPDFIAPKVLDTVVLAGPKWGVGILQAALVANGQHVVCDGIIGMATAGSCARVGPPLLDTYRTLLKAHYDNIVAEHPNLAKFQRGWDARAMDQT